MGIKGKNEHIFPVTAKSGDDRMKAGRITWVLLMAVTVSGAAGYLAEYSTVSSNVNGRELPICSVETEDAKVALTFDVAWENGDLPEILDVLEEEG